MAETRKSSIEMTSQDMGDEKAEIVRQEKTSEDQDGCEHSVACTSSDEFKAELPIQQESSPISDADHA